MPNIAAAQPAINTLFQIGSQGSPQVFNTIANVGDISGPTMDGNVVDVTSHSTGSPWREKIVTLLNPGEASIPLFFIPSSAGTITPGQQFGHDGTNGLLAVFTGRLLSSYKIVFPDSAATSWYFSGYITKFNIDSKVADVLHAMCTFTFTGEPVLV